MQHRRHRPPQIEDINIAQNRAVRAVQMCVARKLGPGAHPLPSIIIPSPAVCGIGRQIRPFHHTLWRSFRQETVQPTCRAAGIRIIHPDVTTPIIMPDASSVRATLFCVKERAVPPRPENVIVRVLAVTPVKGEWRRTMRGSDKATRKGPAMGALPPQQGGCASSVMAAAVVGVPDIWGSLTIGENCLDIAVNVEILEKIPRRYAQSYHTIDAHRVIEVIL